MNAGGPPLESLPGPAGHLRAIADDLDGGWSCVWLVPDSLVGSGDADNLLGVLESRADAVRVPAPQARRKRRTTPQPSAAPVPSADTPAWARATLGVFDWEAPRETPPETGVESTSTVAQRLWTACAGAEEPPGDPIGELAARGHLRGQVVVLCAWEEHDPDDVGALLTRLPAFAKERGLPPGERPRLLLAARTSDVPFRLLDHVDAVTTRVHWWWGTCGRLDTAVVAATTRRPGVRRADRGSIVRELVADEVLVEVAGPDLALAAFLAAGWDGSLAALPAHLEAFTHEVDVDMPRDLRHVRGNPERPPAELRPVWDAGLVDYWDGQLRISPVANGSTPSSANLASLVWRGQNRALTTIVDGHRARLEARVRSRASLAVLDEMSRGTAPPGQDTGERTILELGAMAWAVQTSRVRLSAAERELLFRLRDVRNALAHLRPLDDGELIRLAEVLSP
ncbi:hypothetical protein [Saccharothrix variisporea]|uniref:Uncharacterized protein n=1 Tax=Saccharothrix variisporea TaxID=543527 RepID=A0A495X536_9PSEU|nr:hypothetical protein [Saccharothrix variisporea]RKT68335.1 hypothetical protein DFJ66_1518 [Saccharothrix variisporea]